jgi:hypothetical protein
MSAPDTNLKKQEKRHAGPLIGISAGILLVIVLITGFIFLQVSPPEDDAATGEAAVIESN